MIKPSWGEAEFSQRKKHRTVGNSQGGDLGERWLGVSFLGLKAEVWSQKLRVLSQGEAWARQGVFSLEFGELYRERSTWSLVAGSEKHIGEQESFSRLRRLPRGRFGRKKSTEVAARSVVK